MLTPGPDFIAHAGTAGFPSPILSVEVSALKVDKSLWKDKAIETAEITRINELMKKLNSPDPISDEEILELFALALTVPNIDNGFREGSTFYLNDKHWKILSPDEAGKAIKSWGKQTLTDNQESHLVQFINLIRDMRISSNVLKIVDDKTHIVHFLWKGPREMDS